MKEESTKSERRDFLKAAGAAVAAGFPAIIRAQTVTNAIKVGLVGCGGRGSGAASQALRRRRLRRTDRGRRYRPGADRQAACDR